MTSLKLKANDRRLRILLNQLTEPHWMGAALSEKTVQFFAVVTEPIQLIQLKEVLNHLFARKLHQGSPDL